MIKGFIDGLKKSFSGKTYTRKLKPCMVCGEPSFTDWLCSRCYLDKFDN